MSQPANELVLVTRAGCIVYLVKVTFGCDGWSQPNDQTQRSRLVNSQKVRRVFYISEQMIYREVVFYLTLAIY